MSRRPPRRMSKAEERAFDREIERSQAVLGALLGGEAADYETYRQEQRALIEPVLSLDQWREANGLTEPWHDGSGDL